MSNSRTIILALLASTFLIFRRSIFHTLSESNGALQDPKTIILPRLDDDCSNNNSIITENAVIINSMRRPNHDDVVSIPDFYIPDKRCQTNHENDIIFFHIGKGGGGTVREKLKQASHVSYASNHPIPAHEHQDELLSDESGTANTLIVNVRDPVDRFVSAFKWDLMRTCSSVSGPDSSDERGIIGGQWKAVGTRELISTNHHVKHLHNEKKCYV